LLFFLGLVSIISLSFLAATVFVYSYYEQLRTVHGKCVLHFSVMIVLTDLCVFPYPSPSAFLSDCLLVIGSSFDLAFCFWIIAMAFDISWTFFHFENASEGRTRFLFYCIFVYSSTLIYLICFVAMVVFEHYNYITRVRRTSLLMIVLFG
jgi:hypothetical protein